MEDLYDIFLTVIDYGKIIREKHLDGLKAWNDIKPLFAKQVECGKWNINIKIGETIVSDIKTIYDYVHDELGMKGDENDDNSNHELWEKQHFFLQLIRIIKNNPEFSFIRLMQIAYNIGQLSNYIQSDPIFTEEIRAYFYGNALDQVGSYVDISKCEFDADELNIITDQLDEKIALIKESQNGGNDEYYAKYVKYKNKYLELKSKQRV